MDPMEHPPLSHLICPALRTKYNKDLPCKNIEGNIYHIVEESYYFSSAGDKSSSNSLHHLYPLYRCNNKEPESEFPCGACHCRSIGTTYYFCNECNLGYHRECVESPSLIKSSYHPKHNLQLYKLLHEFNYHRKMSCSYCESSPTFFYYCSICKFSLDLVCARKPSFLNYTKRHEHTLNYFPRKTDLVCDVCGVVDSKSLIFLCLQCDFVVHKTCIYLPFVIRISRHDHRISFTYSPPSNVFSCGVCRQKIDENYGKYSCMNGCTYVVHPKCATRKDLWNGKELEEEPEERYENLQPFEEIGDGIVQHFSHSHQLRFQHGTNILYGEKKQCQACVLPLYDGDIYKCTYLTCDFILHEACANLPRRKYHIAYSHPLILRARDTQIYLKCKLCWRYISGFSYVERIRWEYTTLDVRCAAISEPFEHGCHLHPLFLTTEEGRSKTCSMCKKEVFRPLNCTECDFVLCFRCATLPYKMRYEHDEHFLTLSYQENASLSWCEVCEEAKDSSQWLYTCHECGVTLHIECLLEKNALYIKPNQSTIIRRKKVNIIPNNGLTRPFCNSCRKRCQGTIIFETNGRRRSRLCYGCESKQYYSRPLRMEAY